MNKFAGLGSGIALAMVLVWPPATQVQAGRISGVVVADGGPEHGEPLTGVTVALQSGVQAQNTSSDERGEFAFNDLAPGRYRMTVNKSGYGGLELGAFRLGEEGTPVEVDGPRTSAHVMARLLHPATLSGIVLTEEGRPAADVLILARPVGMMHPDAPASRQERTDVHGRFRFPGVARGEIVLTVIDQSRPRPMRVISYFPGTADPGRAERITIRTGEDRELPPMKLVPVDARIAGTVTMPVGRPAAGASITVQNAFDKVATATTDADGRFEVSVSAGRYDIVASRIDAPQQPGESCSFGGMPRPTLWARQAVDTAATRPGTVALTLKPTALLEGAIVEEFSGRAVADATVILRAVGNMAQDRQVNDHFGIVCIVPDSYGLSVETGRDSPWWLKSATAHGHSLLAGPLVIEPGQRVGNAVLTLSRDRGELSGLVTGKNGLPQTEYWVSVVPLDESVRQPDSPQIVRTRPATNGRFLFDRLPAGEYALSVFGDLGPGEWRKPEILTSLVAGGIKVTVPPGTPVVQNVRVER
jgi:hypothetical protein